MPRELVRFCVVAQGIDDEPMDGPLFMDGASAIEYAQAEATRTGDAYEVVPARFEFVGYDRTESRTVKPKGVLRKGQCVLCSNYALLGWYRTPGNVGVTCCADCAAKQQLTGVAP